MVTLPLQTLWFVFFNMSSPKNTVQHGSFDRTRLTPEAPTKPPLSSLISTHDFRKVAHDTYSRKAWAFISSAATGMFLTGSDTLDWLTEYIRLPHPSCQPKRLFVHHPPAARPLRCVGASITFYDDPVTEGGHAHLCGADVTGKDGAPGWRSRDCPYCLLSVSPFGRSY